MSPYRLPHKINLFPSRYKINQIIHGLGAPVFLSCPIQADTAPPHPSSEINFLSGKGHTYRGEGVIADAKQGRYGKPERYFVQARMMDS
jgi:hypothetical protein